MQKSCRNRMRVLSPQEDCGINKRHRREMEDYAIRRPERNEKV